MPQTSFNLDPQTQYAVDLTARALGMSRSKVMDLAFRFFWDSLSEKVRRRIANVEQIGESEIPNAPSIDISRLREG